MNTHSTKKENTKLKPETNIKCTHCGREWFTKSTAKYATCTSCTRKTLNPLWIIANDIRLYRIWFFTSNDRSESARAIAADFETVQQFCLKTYIKKEYHKDVTLTEFGLEYDGQKSEDCLKNIDRETLSNEDKEAFDENEYNPCEYCEGCTQGFQIEEIEKPSGRSFGETFELKTIHGTNDFYDLTTKRFKKSKDWQPLLKHAWDISPQVGCNMLTGLTKLAIAKDHTVDLEKSTAVKEITKLAMQHTNAKGSKQK